MNDTIKLKKDGAEFDGNLICYFQDTSNSKKYVFYTKADEDAANSPTLKIHVALINQSNADLNMPINDTEWDGLKAIMGNVLKSAASPNVKYLKTTNTLEIADERIIGMPSSYDYVSKHKAVYANEAQEETGGTDEADVPAGTSVSPIIPDVPAADVTPAPEPVATPGFGGNMENTITQQPNIDDVNPIQSLIPDAPGEAQSPEDKPLPTIPETPSAPEPAMNENIQIPPISSPEVEAPKEPEINEPIKEPVSTLTEEEINNKFDNIVNEINALREEALKMVKQAGMEPIAATVVPNTPSDVPITPITPSAPADEGSTSTSSDADRNWFDMPN